MRRSFVLFLLLSVLLVMHGTAGADGTDVVYAVKVKGHIDISPQGTVTGQSLRPSLGVAVDNALKERISEWRFEPVLEGGQAVPVRGLIEVSLVARGTGDELVVAIDDVRFFDSVAARDGNALDIVKRPALAYPKGFEAGSIGAEVTALIEVEQDGSVSRIGAEQITLTSTSPIHSRLMREYAREFEREVLAKIRRWVFDLPTQPAAHSDRRRVRFTVNFVPWDATWTRRFPYEVPALAWSTGPGSGPVIELDSEGNRLSALRLIDPSKGTGATL